MASNLLATSLPFHDLPDGEVVVGYHNVHGWRVVVIGHPYADLGSHFKREAVIEARTMALMRGSDHFWLQDQHSPVLMCNMVQVTPR